LKYDTRNKRTFEESNSQVIDAIEGKETLGEYRGKAMNVKATLEDLPRDFAKLDYPSEREPTRSKEEFSREPIDPRFSIEHAEPESAKVKGKDSGRTPTFGEIDHI
jgi:hypothetical protein